MPEVLIQKVYHNRQWKEFLDSLPNQHDKDIAGKTMDWIKRTYPEFADVLNGKLVWEHKQGKLRGE